MKAYLGWPVKLKGNLTAAGAHITLKFLGEIQDTEALIADIASRLDGKQTAFPLNDGFAEVRWAAEKFNRITHVMVFEDYDPLLDITRAAVRDLREEDYPTWRPHVTLPRSIWSFIAFGALSPWQCIESIGPLTLFVKDKAGYEAKKTF